MKRTIAILMVLIVSLFAVVGVFAQDDTTPEATPEATEESTSTRPDRQRGGRGGAIFTIVSETLGVDEAELRTALQEDGATWASVIESLGGNVDEIQALIVAQITTDLEARLAEVETHVTDVLNNPVPQRGNRDGGMGPRDGGRGGRGGRGFGGAQDDAPATEDEASFGEAPANS